MNIYYTNFDINCNSIYNFSGPIIIILMFCISNSRKTCKICRYIFIDHFQNYLFASVMIYNSYNKNV